jgi:hypothetical protein
MKTQHILSALLLILMLVFNSCREISVTTKINADGTFTRTIRVTGDSSEVISGDLPFPVDETWSRTFSKDTADTTRFLVTYSKAYRNSDILNNDLKSDTSVYRFLDKKVSIHKKSGFFFSYITFREVYKCANPFTTLDYRKYISEADIRISNGTEIPLTPADSAHKKEADDNILDYILKSAVAELETITSDGIRKLGDESLNTVNLAVYHDSLCAEIERTDFKKGEDVLDMYANLSGNEAFLKLKSLQPPLYQEFDQKLTRLDTLLELAGYKEIVEMPGLITGTNSAKLNGNQVSWDFETISLLVCDTEFFAESRVINLWAFSLSGFVIFFLVTILVIRSFRK